MKKIILCPFYFEKNMLSFLRKEHAFFDVKFITKEEILRCYFGEFKKGALQYLIKSHHLSFAMAKTYLNYLPYLDKDNCDDEKSRMLLDIRNELIDCGYFKKDEYFLNLIKNQEVDIYGYSDKDSRFNKILDRLNVTCSYHLNERKNIENSLYSYESHEEEIHALFIRICDLLSHGTNINDILIYGADEDYQSMIKRYADLYKIPFNGFKSLPLNSFDFGKDFYKLFAKNKDLDETIKLLDEKYQLSENYLTFKEKILADKDEELNFDEQFDFYKNSLNIKLTPTILDNAVNLIDDFDFVKDKHIFVIGFAQGIYPKVRNDNDFLADDIKKKHFMLTTKQENIIAKQEMLNFLNSDNYFYFSYANKVYFNVRYPSFLKDNLNLKVVKSVIPEYDYSKKASQLVLLKLKDLRYKYREVKPQLKSYEKIIDFNYRGFDNQFKTFNVIDKNKDIYFSYTSLKKYIFCPFSYYLDKILKVDDFETNFSAKLGTAFHAVLEEGLRNENLSFKDLYEKHFNDGFDEKEKLLCESIKDDVNIALKTVRDQKLRIRNPQIELEKELIVKIADHCYLKGFIDKMIISDDKFVTLIDYKTSKYDNFNPNLVPYGGSLQLPIYALLTSEDINYRKYKVGGLFINHILPPNKNVEIDENGIPKYLKLDGKFLESQEYITGMEPGYPDGDVRYIRYRMRADKSLFSKGATFNDQDLKKFIETARGFIKDSDAKIRNNQFEISPMLLKNESACTFCPYADICFKKQDQVREISLDKEASEDEVE